MAATALPTVRTADLVSGMYFKTNGRWNLADSAATTAPNGTRYGIYAYDTDGHLTWLSIYDETVEINAGVKPPESFSQHKLLSRARKLEDDANGMLGRVARLRQFAARLESKKEV